MSRARQLIATVGRPHQRVAWMIVAALPGAVLAAAMSVTALGSAVAQTAEQDAVLQRPRPDYDQQCAAVDGPFSDGTGPGSPILLCPDVTVGGGYSDNVFRTGTGEESDHFVVAEPQLRLLWTGETYGANIGARGAFTRYQDVTQNDSDDYAVDASGGIEITEDIGIQAEGSFGRFHDERDNPDRASAALDVTEFTLGRERLRFEYKPVDWVFRLTGEARQIDYRDNGPVENDDRDRAVYGLTVRTGRNFMPGLTVFVEPNYNVRRYRDTLDAAGFNRDSQGFAVRAGVTYDATGVTFLELGGGYFQQDFVDARFGDEKGLSIQGRVVWNATDLATVTVELARAVTESTLVDVSSVVDTDVALGLDYELLDYLLLSGQVGYLNSDFGSSGRRDDSFRGRLALIGLVNEYVSLTGSYQYADRISNAAGEDFRSNTFRLSLGLQF